MSRNPSDYPVAPLKVLSCGPAPVPGSAEPLLPMPMRSPKPKKQSKAPDSDFDNFVKRMPQITKDAGYPLLSKFFTLWLSSKGMVASTLHPVDWDEIVAADNKKQLSTHLEVARKAAKFSLLPKRPNGTQPSMAGFRPKVRELLQQRLSQSFGRAGPRADVFDLPVYEIPISSYWMKTNTNLVDRLSSTRKIVQAQGSEALSKEFETVSGLVNTGLFPALSPDIDKDGVTVKASELLAALGSFTVFVSIRVRVVARTRSKMTWRAEEMTFRVVDDFKFEEDFQLLGPWTESGMRVTPFANLMTNKRLREFGKRHGLSPSIPIGSSKTEAFETPSFEFKPRPQSPSI